MFPHITKNVRETDSTFPKDAEKHPFHFPFSKFSTAVLPFGLLRK